MTVSVTSKLGMDEDVTTKKEESVADRRKRIRQEKESKLGESTATSFGTSLGNSTLAGNASLGSGASGASGKPQMANVLNTMAMTATVKKNFNVAYKGSDSDDSGGWSGDSEDADGRKTATAGGGRRTTRQGPAEGLHQSGFFAGTPREQAGGSSSSSSPVRGEHGGKNVSMSLLSPLDGEVEDGEGTVRAHAVEGAHSMMPSGDPRSAKVPSSGNLPKSVLDELDDDELWGEGECGVALRGGVRGLFSALKWVLPQHRIQVWKCSGHFF